MDSYEKVKKDTLARIVVKIAEASKKLAGSKYEEDDVVNVTNLGIAYQECLDDGKIGYDVMGAMIVKKDAETLVAKIEAKIKEGLHKALYAGYVETMLESMGFTVADGIVFGLTFINLATYAKIEKGTLTKLREQVINETKLIEAESGDNIDKDAPATEHMRLIGLASRAYGVILGKGDHIYEKIMDMHEKVGVHTDLEVIADKIHEESPDSIYAIGSMLEYMGHKILDNEVLNLSY
jgi:hypothetical protein